ncbi:Hsp20/alpha crystallin family protein [Halodesulfurarchaeum sp. HSR-GB]|uniref:Hsp20/alpha crystallin family protein n=1 Tax=Halodesulfurarchaeum sp. HSR-GB TaxID=3074077 RepID=UPI00285C7291|nr:Hsp20/alpha crystallin family protein [Halodesulfurarchaeum sp. HSR-GB]MDR5655979.1 Hsp20/alpha crystallin family protein [Halodesulfurarchaeum sp. HSR-GB]
MTRRSNPFEEIERLLERMSNQFEDVDQIQSLESAWPGRLKVDLAEFEDAYEVTADLPGFESEDIDVELLDDQLHICAERKTETEEADEGRYIRQERSERSIDRRVSLPEPVEAEAVEASFKNGVLTVCLPKAEGSEESHTIEIE